MEKIEATFRIVTPMFIGGGDQTPNDGIRPPSVKGALRFWWRAMNWARFYNLENDEILALREMHKAERDLFGAAADERGGGQATFLLTVQHKDLDTSNEGDIHSSFKPTKRKPKNGKSAVDENHLAGSRYLSYGLMTAFTSVDRDTKEIKSSAGQLDRGCLNDNQIFTVSLLFRESVDEAVLNALKIFGLLGGLGSRSRHGLGSLALQNIVRIKKNQKHEIWCAPTDETGYKNEIKTLLGDLSRATQPEYSAFSKQSRVDILFSCVTPESALDQFGLKMLDYRSWGQSKRNNILPSGKISEKRFKDDHDWFYDTQSDKIEIPKFHPKRIMFGLPHNYHKDDKYHVTPHRCSGLIV